MALITASVPELTIRIISMEGTAVRISSASSTSPLVGAPKLVPLMAAAVTTFTTEQEALTLANDSDYGLGAAIWTRDLSKAHRMSRRLKAGSVFVNNYNDGDMTVPFGGYKQSGNGRDKSLHALEKFTELKTIWISLE